MSFFSDKIISEGLTFDDVLLIPEYSEVFPGDTVIKSMFSKRIPMNIPIITAAMDTVTEAPMAIAIAKLGGIGVIHRNMSVKRQVEQVNLVKKAKINNLHGENSDTTDNHYLPEPSVDNKGRLLVAASVGICKDVMDRIDALVKASVDAIIIDSAHAHSKIVLDILRKSKSRYSEPDFIVGNIATGEAATDLVLAGADAVKVGIGPGSIRTTHSIAGVGIPQLSAIYAVSSALKHSGIPIIADGGIRSPGDIVKAIAAGADSIMAGSIFTGIEESPGETIFIQGKKYKRYRGLDSKEVINERYHELNDEEINMNNPVPEGIVVRIPYKGSLNKTIIQLSGGLRAGMGYCGAKTIEKLKQAKFIRITQSGVREGYPHDINSNYQNNY
ncbi:MAG: IMP dehydrogenase [Prolixibacteraceae bacterium]|nr:IMP dehydrogenase [Prolixibacteraceae bacterium]